MLSQFSLLQLSGWRTPVLKSFLLFCFVLLNTNTALSQPTFKPGLNPQGRVETIKAIVSQCHAWKVTKSQCAYILATAEHESNFQSIREAPMLSDNYRKRHFYYYPYYGRGYTQLTHLFNYKLYSRILAIDLVANPDLALRKDIAMFILFHGSVNGTFTGYRLGHFIGVHKADFYNARKVINGLDKAGKIADRARFWYSRLTVY